MCIEQNRINILNSLGKIARDVSFFPNVRIVAALYKRNKLISLGCNQNKTHPMQLEFNRWDNPHKIYLHAEIDAIRKAKSLGENIEGCDIYVARILRNNSLALAKPCKGCFKCIKDHGITNIFYSIKDYEYGTIFPRT